DLSAFRRAHLQLYERQLGSADAVAEPPVEPAEGRGGGVAASKFRPEVEQTDARIDLAAAHGKAIGRVVVDARLAGGGDPVARFGADARLAAREEAGGGGGAATGGGPGRGGRRARRRRRSGSPLRPRCAPRVRRRGLTDRRRPARC